MGLKDDPNTLLGRIRKHLKRKQKMEIFSKESIYDEKISPLMDEIIKICNDHGIPMVASFTYENCEEKGVGRCTTHINNVKNRSDDVVQVAMRFLRNGGDYSACVITKTTMGEEK
jgi:hypothetical protein